MVDRRLTEREQRREKFCRMIEKSIPELKKEIAEKKEILVAPEDLRKKLGLEVSYIRHPTSIYWDAKYCLWKDGIVVTSRKTDGKMTVIRARIPEDELPTELK